MPFFGTVIVVEKKDKIDWAGWSNDLRTYTSGKGTEETQWRTATWSPTALSEIGGCVLAALTNNQEALVFEPSKNSHRGEWIETFDFTSALAHLLLPCAREEEDPETLTAEGELDRTLQIFQCQATSISWSLPVEGTLGDYSLLAIGHKSGHVSLWRRWAGKMEVLHRYRVHDEAQWIKALSWSPWQLRRKGPKTLAVSFLAVADSSGQAWNMEVTEDVSAPRIAIVQDLQNVEEDANGVSAAQPLSLASRDGRQITQFCWILQNGVYRLAYTKLGTLNCVTLKPALSNSSTLMAISEDIELELECVGASQWTGATPFASCAGIVYVPSSQTLVVALSSSCFYTVAMHPTPAFAPPSETIPSSTDLTARMRRVFVNQPRSSLQSTRYSHLVATPTKREGAKTSGFTSFGEDGELAWTSELDLPHQALYRQNPAIRTTLFVSRLIAEPVNSSDTLEGFRSLLESPPNSRIKSPLAALRSLLHYIHDNQQDTTFLDGLYSILQHTKETFPPVSSAAMTREDTLATFGKELFGEPGIECLRLKETVARFITRLPHVNSTTQVSVGLLQASLSRRVAQELLSRISVILSRAETHLTTEELAVSGRILLASASIQIEDASTSAGPDSLSSSFNGTEQCPACSAPVQFSSIRRAQCSNGHEWERCSLTLAMLSSIKVRTCIGCERKALISARAMEETEVGLVDLLLRVATCCLYCGGRWMRIR